MANSLSLTACKTRREYWKKWNAGHPENRKATRARYWENRAKNFYGPDYEGPKPGQDLSDHARDVRKMYYREYRKTHAEDLKRNIENYWERQAEKSKHSENTGKGITKT